MTIQFNTDNNIAGFQELSETYKSSISRALKRFSNQITRIEVHLSDENSHKYGQKDKRCMMEARLEGVQPIAVTSQADNIEQAVRGATEKLKSSLENTLGKMRG